MPTPILSVARLTTRASRLLALVVAVAIAAAAATAAAQPAAPGAPHAITLDDMIGWKTIGPAVLSADGRWVAYRFSPSRGDSEVVVRSTTSDKEYRFTIGELPPPPEQGAAPPVAPRSADIAIAEDGTWAAFLVYPLRKDAEKLRQQKKPIQTSVKLVNLGTGEAIDYPKSRQFAFSGDSAAAFAVHRYGPDEPGRDKPKGATLIVRDLAAGTELALGNVGEFSFDKAGRRLAWTIDADDQLGNGVHMRDLSTGAIRTFDSARAVYERLAWTDEGDALAALRGVTDKKFDDRLYSVIGVSAVGTASPVVTVFDPAKDATFPAGMSISPNRTPSWTGDRAALLFGIHAPKAKAEKGDDKKEGDAEGADAPAGPRGPSAAPSDDKADLVLWHWKDARLQSQQQVQEQRDRRFSFLATYRIAAKKFIRLADEDMRDVTLPEHGRYAIGIDRRAWEIVGALEGRNFQDVYTVDLETGARALARKQVRWSYAPSPDGTKWLFYDDGHYYVHDLAANTSKNVTLGLPVSFVDVEDDHNVVKPPVSPVGWSSDGQHVLLSDAWDVWQVPTGSGTAVNLTGNGRKDAIRYGRRFVLDPDEKGIDLAVAQYFDVQGERTKKGGIARVTASKPGAEILGWGDVAYARLMKAERADRFAWTRESATTFPDLHVTDASFATPVKLTDGQAQLTSVTWMTGARLVDYTSAKGDKLQAALYLPANYEPGKRYPTIVYIYEKLSDQLNRFASPTANGFNRSFYTSNGYAVLMPDITYTLNDPGMSAVWCVLPALQAAIATGVVDATRVGLQGHSWGGYQTSFLVTQTNAFKAAVAGAPLTNMVSMYSLVYKNTGGANMAIFESSQGRFRGGYWDNWEAYARNSPVMHATKVTTPLVILHNDKDGAVDFTQGVEYYNTLRRLQKPVVMLQYKGENHGLAKPENRKDYSVRMREFFDHYLMGKPAPDWWTEGVPHLKLDDHLKKRK
jgi:dipeptidyl aminopeptidase/acylaminoacyl peptidase